MTHTIQRHHSNTRMSKIVQHGGLIFLCGQTSSGTSLASIDDQTSEVLRRINALLAEVGSDRSHLLSATVYLNQIEDFAAMNAVWEAWVPPGTAPRAPRCRPILLLRTGRLNATRNHNLRVVPFIDHEAVSFCSSAHILNIRLLFSCNVLNARFSSCTGRPIEVTKLKDHLEAVIDLISVELRRAAISNPTATPAIIIG